jgi:hypothetical protein
MVPAHGLVMVAAHPPHLIRIIEETMNRFQQLTLVVLDDKPIVYIYLQHPIGFPSRIGVALTPLPVLSVKDLVDIV